MRLFYLLPVAVLGAGIGGCGWLQHPDYGPVRDRHHDYVKAKAQPQMQLAPGQTSKPLSPLYPVPDAQADGTASLYIPPRPAPAPMLATEVFVVQETAWQSWILAQREPAQVWPLAQAFFISRGFVIEDEHAEQGEFIARHKTGSSVDSASSSLDYLVRIQPGLEAKTSELMLEYSSAGEPFSASNLQLVNGALNPLQQYMLSASERGDSYSLLASYNQRGPQERVQNLGGNLILRVQTDMEQAWPAVGRALLNSGFYIKDQSQKQAIYVLDLEREVQTKKRGFLSKFNTMLKDVHQKIEDEKRQEREAERLAAGKALATAPEHELLIDERFHQLRLREQEGQVVLSLEDSEQQPAESNLASSVLNRLREQLNREDFAQVETASQQHLFVERLVQLEPLGDSWQLRLQGKSKARAWQDLDRVLQSEYFVRIDELAAEAVFVISIREQQWRREDNPMSLSSIYQRIEAEKRLEREREQQARKNRKEKPKEIAKYRLAVQSDVGDSLLLIQNEDGSAATSDEAMQIMQRIQQLLD